MLIAKVINNEVVQVENYLVLYPLLTFAPSGPTPEQMLELGCMHVNLFKAHDQEAQTLEACAPYIEGDWVYLVQVRGLTQYELNARVQSKKSMNQNRAANLLKDSDFYDLPNTSNKIANIAAITIYRDAIRLIALNPPEVVTEWPIKPTTEWLV